MTAQTLTQTNGRAGDALQLSLSAAILKLLPVDDRARELQLMDEADEARWLEDTLTALDTEAGPPPF